MEYIINEEFLEELIHNYMDSTCGSISGFVEDFLKSKQPRARDFFIPKSILKSKNQAVIDKGVIIKLDGNYYVGKRINGKTCIIYSKNLHRFFNKSEKILNNEILEEYIDKEIELIIREK